MDRIDVEKTIARATLRATCAVKATFPEGEDVLDPNALTSSMEEVRSRVDAFLSSRRASRLLRFAGAILSRLVTTQAFREYALDQQEANLRAGDEMVAGLLHGPELLELLLSADSRVRHGGVVGILDLYPFDPRECPNLAPLNGLGHFEELVGEHRAVEVLRMFVPVCESLYLRVARGVRKIELFADGKKMAPDLSLGNVLSAARDRNGYAAQILDLDAAWIRNAAAHSHYRYLPADRALELWNKDGARRRFPVAVLEERLRAILEFSVSTAPAVISHYQHKFVIARGGLDEAFLDLLPALFNRDRTDSRDRRERFVAVLERELAPLARVLDPNWDQRRGLSGGDTAPTGSEDER